MEFERPGYLWLLTLLPLLGFLLHRYLASGRSIRSIWGGVSGPSPDGPGRREAVSAWLAALGFVSLVMALAAPFTQSISQRPRFRQKNLVILLDASPSMNSQDVWPSRMERAKQVIRNFVERDTEMARFGLVSFSESSIILSYLTSDPGNLLFYLDFLRPDRRTIFGTDIGAALTSGLRILERHQEGEGGDGEELSRSGLMVLVSDGEDQGEGLSEALEEISRLGIRVHTVGIGTSQGGVIPLVDEDGTPGYLEDGNGVRLVSRLTVETLKEISKASGGRFFQASSGPALEAALDAILKTEREVTGYQVGPTRREMFHFFVGLAFVSQLSLMLLRF